ncbi:MAG: hypothetical protein CME65_08815 [Halobacteriovoraceae bacterium]|nr:hypothetical protein [Halobacteriovoraceae bacterium]|tara:strand:+ start:639 stop:1418 length:780 start_codon:yes stop_codon:yes gene_type:complete
MRFWSLIAIIILFSCGKTEETTEVISTAEAQAEASDRYFSSTEKFVVNVYYEPGAEPFEGNTSRGFPYWRILEDNLEAIFQYRSTTPTLQVPKELSEMNPIDAQNQTNWNAESVYQLHERTQSPSKQAGEDHFYIYFLKGNAETSNNTIGFSINGTAVIAIFKDVITASGSPAVQKYTEQSTLVHEMGHALGLVNNGIPIVSNHQDPDKTAHTSNSDCIMYWQNEGASDLRQFVLNIITSGNTVMWGPEVLEDVESISK